MSVMAQTDFWGSAVPAWLGAIASLTASGVALIALLKGQAAERGVRVIARGMNDTPPDAPGPGATNRGDARDPVVHQPWTVTERGNGLINFRNSSGNDVKVQAIKAASETISLTFGFRLPADVSSGASFDVRVERRLGGSTVVGVMIEWTVGGNQYLTHTYYV